MNSVMSDETPQFGPIQKPLLVVISGPSGVGKDSVLQRMKDRGSQFHFVVTATTRPARPEETDGVDYIFVGREEFAQLIEQEELLEYALVYGDYKGIPKEQVRKALASGEDVVMRVDVQGAATVRKISPGAILIFLTTSSEEELVERLEKRKTESAEDLAIRIATARQEFKRVDEFDYIVVNRENELDKTVDVITAIIQAEHHRVVPRQVDL
jgi:guanylate kinase